MTLFRKDPAACEPSEKVSLDAASAFCLLQAEVPEIRTLRVGDLWWWWCFLQVAPGTDRSPLWSDFNLAVREVSQQLHDHRLNVPNTVRELSSRQNNKLVRGLPHMFLQN